MPASRKIKPEVFEPEPTATLLLDSTLVTKELLFGLPDLSKTFFSASPVMPLPLVPRPTRVFQFSLTRPSEFTLLLPMVRFGASATGVISTLTVASLPTPWPSVGLNWICA
ncbi:hypothetical protein D3C77_548790 [compost metagenome]